MIGEMLFEVRQNGGPSGNPNGGPQRALMQQAIAFSQAMAARGVQISPAQVLQLMLRHQLSNVAQRGGRL